MSKALSLAASLTPIFQHSFQIVFHKNLDIFSVCDLENPYRFKSYRKMVDATAFLLYGHWIKKDEHQNQNRATLFQAEEKSDLIRHAKLREQRRLDRQDSILRHQNESNVETILRQ
jgi:hypothetical protein